MRVLLSVYFKDDLIEFARGLVELGHDLIASGGTAIALQKADIPHVTVESVTNTKEMPGGRVKTLHPNIHGPILADRDDEDQMAWLNELGLPEIGMVVCNLYPFSDTVASGASPEAIIEKIDVGGPTMVRAAAKNWRHVASVVDPADYPIMLSELRRDGEVAESTRRRLAGKAFNLTASYDAAIANWFNDQAGNLLPDQLHFSLIKAPVSLRYGENPHQAGAVYMDAEADPWWRHLTQLSGIPMSYLNMYDADAAWRLVHEEAFGDRPICAIIKHANPCGFAIADTLADAYQRAYQCDPLSAFGGIVAFNRPLDGQTAEAMVEAAQADVVIAPAYEGDVVLKLVKKRKNTRLIKAPAPTADRRHLRQITGGMLVQQPHHFVATDPSAWPVVTERKPTPAELEDGLVAFVLGGYVKSNSIVHVKDQVAWGIGAGQQNRLESAGIATHKAKGRAAGGATGSDAFFPYTDGIDVAAEAGVALVVQPGGAMKDEEIIARANLLGLAMCFTGERHFNH